MGPINTMNITKDQEMRDEIPFTRQDSERLVRIETMLQQTNNRLDAYITKTEELESSIEKVKVRQGWMTGVGSAIAFILALIFNSHH